LPGDSGSIRAEEIAATFLPDAEINKSAAQHGSDTEERSVARPTRRVFGIAIEGELIRFCGEIRSCPRTALAEGTASPSDGEESDLAESDETDSSELPGTRAFADGGSVTGLAGTTGLDRLRAQAPTNANTTIVTRYGFTVAGRHSAYFVKLWMYRRCRDLLTAMSRVMHHLG